MTSEHGALPHPYDGGPPASAPSDLAIASMLLAGGLTLVQLVNTVLAFPAGAAIEGSTSQDVFDELEVVLYALSTTAIIPAGIAAYVVTCLWLAKCRKNAERFAPDYRQERGAVWAWLGWWVPIVSFWFPYQVVRDIRRASVQIRGDSAALGWWWLCWLVWLIGSRFAGNLLPEDASASGARGAAEALPLIETVNGVAIVVALVLWIRLVREITRAQATLVTRDVSQINRW
jgi:hypothetical protein